MKFGDIEFTDRGKPCGILRIRSIEKKIGRKLPADYKKFIMKTGGGCLSLKNTYLFGVLLPSGEELEANVEIILGNDPTGETDFDLAEAGEYFTEEWEIPSDVLLIGNTEAGMHECFVINYDLPEFPRHSVLYLDNDIPGEFTLIARSFSEFLSMLAPDSDYDPDDDLSIEESREQTKKQHKIRSQKGALSPQLQESIEATGIPDYEQIVRRAAYQLACVDLGFFVSGYNKKWAQLLDVVYWAAQHVQPCRTVKSFKGPIWDHIPWDGNEYQFMSLVRASFVLEGERGSISCSEAMLELWWQRRIEPGVLVETPEGFKLKDEYIAPVLEALREDIKNHPRVEI
ncbi:SMI1/KNR4 family protein [Corynebacterium anserum]|uniref:Uncharacterized protein n=1 Tax=Corynebacterium anserum TaxID=2684406 RepID=A0A7G7YQ95_9CORY|nr:SMI1/KNR4 family protein [Corynebacterium anserum]MBC2682342.1 hypothetical protein [Corynebacterium anserum]QNH96665.1 hypothetical protein GP473_08390 [Corynebacterium anserum]